MFDHLKLNCDAVNTVFMCKFGIKYQYAGRAVCAYAYVFWKRPGCVLIGACSLIRTNTVYQIYLLYINLTNYRKSEVPVV